MRSFRPTPLGKSIIKYFIFASLFIFLLASLFLALIYLAFPSWVARYSPWVGPCIHAIARMTEREDYDFRQRFIDRVPDISSYAQRGGDEEVRKAALWVLGIIGEESSIRVFVDGAHDPSYAIKIHSIDGLSKLRNSDLVIQTITPFVDDEDDQIRGLVADGLGRHLKRSSILLLQALSMDEKSAVRCRAMSALGMAMSDDDRALCISIIKKVIESRGVAEPCAARALKKLSGNN